MSREYPCVYHKNGLCEKESEPGYINHCVFGPCKDETPSNGDRIRAMSDEELADAIVKMACGIDPAESFCQNKEECEDLMDADKEIPDEWCRQCVLAMLRQPAEA